MESLFAFSEYDIIAYLMVGIAALIVFDFVLHTHFIFRAKWNTGTVTGVLILAYIVGHLTAIPSEFFLEELLVKDTLGQPIDHLVPTDPCTLKAEGISWKTFVPLRYYFRSAACNIRNRVAAKEPNSRGSELFSEAFAAAKQDAIAYERMTIFQRLYILFRNMAILSIFAAVVVVTNILRAAYRNSTVHKRKPAHDSPPYLTIKFGVQPWITSPPHQLAFFAVLSLGLLDRYIYFYHLYALEVLSAFAYGATVLE